MTRLQRDRLSRTLAYTTVTVGLAGTGTAVNGQATVTTGFLTELATAFTFVLAGAWAVTVFDGRVRDAERIARAAYRRVRRLGHTARAIAARHATELLTDQPPRVAGKAS